MRIAIVGTGISAMTCARLLHPDHEIHVFEAGDYVGGHTNTVAVEHGGRRFAVDTGFIVFNEWTYPNFIRLLRALRVATQPSDMSFSVSSKHTGFEYNGTSLNTLFAQRANLLRPSFHRMIRDILRFGREAPRLLEGADDALSLGEYLDRHGYSREFVERYVLPMGGAIWSAESAAMRSFPARYFVEFFHNHGMLSVDRRPRWRVVSGGSARYMEALTRPFRRRIRLNASVRSIRRHAQEVEVTTTDGSCEAFDHVVVGTHSDQALAVLADPSEREREVLGAIPYRANEAVLHTDERVLPRRKLAWAAWNYHLDARSGNGVSVTYWMNRLQSLDAPVQFCVTLNDASSVDPSRIVRRIGYHHPVYTHESVAAQRRWREISGERRTSFCGAYWGFGFHEDGVKSGLAVAADFGRSLADLETGVPIDSAVASA